MPIFCTTLVEEMYFNLYLPRQVKTSIMDSPQSSQCTYLPTYRPTYLPTYLLTDLPTYLEGTQVQCNQMARLRVQYLDVCSKKQLPQICHGLMKFCHSGKISPNMASHAAVKFDPISQKRRWLKNQKTLARQFCVHL